ncbi:hypothetical protein [Burkholderia sp. Ax-1719]|uniref:hypothetical protein n=1 Tax=Burkholderia sp. Ax-1719 TaxID=2608334 RepID=UPI00141EB04A|nr:hypothetical protein [Burkholderia sp. Ax-1719]NIE63054.1 hypothetical protein [Burkholderia sp. Ax-1719]
MQTLAPQTFAFIESAINALENFPQSDLRWLAHHRRFNWRHYYANSIGEASRFILELEAAVPAGDLDGMTSLEPGEIVDDRYPVYHDVVDVIPVYKDAIILETHRTLVPAKKIPRLLRLLQIPGHSEGMDVENHNFGYHFHYGKVKSNSVERSNLLLTFDPRKKSRKSPVLYGEYHAEGKTKSINMETIGLNKRLPIYLVCENAAKKRGFENFKMAADKAKIFHSPDRSE